MRPNHLHLKVEAAGFRKLITAFYPEGDTYIESDAVFGVKKSLVVVSMVPWNLVQELTFNKPQTLETVNDEAEARKRGFPKGNTFKLLQRDVILVPQK